MRYDADLNNNKLRTQLRDILGPYPDFDLVLKTIEEAIYEEAARRHPTNAPVDDDGHALARGMYQAAEVIRAARLNTPETTEPNGYASWSTADVEPSPFAAEELPADAASGWSPGARGQWTPGDQLYVTDTLDAYSRMEDAYSRLEDAYSRLERAAPARSPCTASSGHVPRHRQVDLLYP
ncbi:hypothetical protein [Allosalinactinospora lopnorensis]|uniref:hypothetical protein n=1 Tax=Allosalinactinospora lopnorensis TaxID=1352348 RepID=UPI000623E2E4|nr:hypothetical protein [Allosalinactinospora lopnorensis]